MCGRYTLFTDPEDVAAQFGLDEAPRLAPRYNIAPTQPVGIVRRDHGDDGQSSGAREWALVHWGLIPSWSNDPSIGARMINARAETAAEKPSFRAAMRRRRCLVPVDGFYEWKKEGRSKQPFFIHLRQGGPFALAGLWEIWTGPEGSELQSCTILTTEPNEMMAGLHNRMPVILAPEDYDMWLGSGADATKRELETLQHLLRSFPPELMNAYPVSRYVNSPQNEGAECIEPETVR